MYFVLWFFSGMINSWSLFDKKLKCLGFFFIIVMVLAWTLTLMLNFYQSWKGFLSSYLNKILFLLLFICLVFIFKNLTCPDTKKEKKIFSCCVIHSEIYTYSCLYFFLLPNWCLFFLDPDLGSFGSLSLCFFFCFAFILCCRSFALLILEKEKKRKWNLSIFIIKMSFIGVG